MQRFHPVPAEGDSAPRAVGDDPVVDVAWEEALRSFLIELKNRGYSLLTLRDYQGDVERLRRAVAVAPGELSTEHVDAALAAWTEEGLAPGLVRRKRSALRCFLAFLGRACERTCGAADLWVRMRHAPVGDRLLLGFVAAAGARLTELCALEGRDVKTRSGVVRLRTGMRIVPMHPALRKLLDDARFESPGAPFRPVLGGHHGFPVNSRTMHARFRRATARLGVPDLRPDDLRRELAAHLAAEKTPPGLVAAFLARDRGRPLAPRRGTLADLSCLAERIASYPLDPGAACPRRETGG